MTPPDDRPHKNSVGLLLVDVQQDYLKKKLEIPEDDFVQNLSKLLASFRELSLPVVHSQTLVKPDGSNRMPHQKEQGIWRCIEGTPGSLPPGELTPVKEERIFSKTFYSAFSNPDLNKWLQELEVDQLIIAGLYTHACVHATILDAYRLGYKVIVPYNGVASGEVLHSQLSKEWLGSRACTFQSVSELTYDLKRKSDTVNLSKKISDSQKTAVGVSYSFGKWKYSKDANFWEQRNPSNQEEILGYVPIGRPENVEKVLQSAKKRESDLKKTSVKKRLEGLSEWLNELEKREDEIVSLLALEVGKPIKTGREEFQYGLNLLKETIRRVKHENNESSDSGVEIRYRPLGTVAVITPWNNPFAIPLGKIVPALAYGNSVVWKPALQSPKIASLLVETMESSSLPEFCLTIVHGDATTAQLIARQEGVKAISFTGSISGGHDLATISSQNGKRLQAEMGGNNAVLIGRSSDVSQIAKELVPAVYSFSGQRCTAPRRLIVAEEIFDEFTNAFVNEMDDLKMGTPDQPDIQIGPLISKSQQNRMESLVKQSVTEGATLLKGGSIPKDFGKGCWYPPTLLTDVSPLNRVFREESFGPIAVLLKFSDFRTAIELCNAVPHGLTASVYSNDEKEIKVFLNQVEAGILRVNSQQSYFSNEAPFNGWKKSGSGIAEHGRWDREFYTRIQTVYSNRKS